LAALADVEAGRFAAGLSLTASATGVAARLGGGTTRFPFDFVLAATAGASAAATFFLVEPGFLAVM